MFFKSCTFNTGPISQAEIGFEHIFEIGIFKGKKFTLEVKAQIFLSNEYFFV